MKLRLSKFHIPKFIVDVASLLSGRIAVMAVGFVYSVLLARFLGPENKGIVTAILAIPGILYSFVDLGVRQATAYYLGKGIYDEQAVISTVTFTYLFTSAFGFCLVLIAYLVTGMFQKYGLLAVAIALLVLPLQMVNVYASGVLLAKQRLAETAFANILHEIVRLGLVLLLLGFDLLQVKSVLFAEVFGGVITALYVVFIVRQYGRLLPRYIPGVPLQFIKKGVVYAIAMFIIGLNYRVDTVIMGQLSTAQELGIYSVGVNIAEMLWLVSNALVIVNFSRSAVSKDANAYAVKTALVLRLTLFVALFPGLALYFLSPWVVPLIYGGSYVASSVVVQAILPGIWISLVFKILNSDLAGRGRPEAALWVYALAVVLNICLNIWWVPVYGALGSAWASSISYALGAILFAFSYARMSKLRFVDLFVLRFSDIRMITQQFSSGKP